MDLSLRHRTGDRPTACVAATVAGLSQLAQDAVVVAIVLILTGCGAGSVVGWAVRMMLSHLATVGALTIRALPVVLLTALVFFNGYVWLMAATISGDRLGLAMAFLVSIAAAFVVSATRERVRPMLRSTATVLPNDTEKLADTPFATMPDTPDCASAEKGRTRQCGLCAGCLAVCADPGGGGGHRHDLLDSGADGAQPELLNEWTHTYKSTATVLGLTLPMPDSLIHMTLFLGALTFMYISARAAGDAEYRSTFVDPLIDDLRTTLIARNRYRGAVAVAACVDGTEVSD
jgi:hypothetical protein